MAAHPTSIRTYVSVFVALLVLLGLTLAVASIEHAALGLLATLSIATLKAGLIMAFFMHIRSETPLIRMIAIAGVLWLAILIGMILADLESRARENPIQPSSGQNGEGPHRTGLGIASTIG